MSSLLWIFLAVVLMSVAGFLFFKKRHSAPRESDTPASLPEVPMCFQCQSRAVPIKQTGNRYRCKGCGKQFTGAKHGF